MGGLGTGMGWAGWVFSLVCLGIDETGVGMWEVAAAAVGKAAVFWWCLAVAVLAFSLAVLPRINAWLKKVSNGILSLAFLFKSPNNKLTSSGDVPGGIL